MLRLWLIGMAKTQYMLRGAQSSNLMKNNTRALNVTGSLLLARYHADVLPALGY